VIYQRLQQTLEEFKWNDALRVLKKATIIKLNLGFCALTDILKLQIQSAIKRLQLALTLHRSGVIKTAATISAPALQAMRQRPN
jgi:hypothetical protein